MNRRRASLPHALLTAALAAGTTWLALLSWRGFLERPDTFVVPAAVLACTVAATGAVARWRRVPAVLVVVGQVVVAAAFVLFSETGDPVPSPANVADLVEAVRLSVESARTYAAPVPAEAPPLTALLLPGAALCLVAVDLVACTLRRAPLAGLVLVGAHTLPLGIVGDGETWWVFAAATATFLALLFVHHDEALGRWGRPLDSDASSRRVRRPRLVRTSAVALGGTSIALAVVLPLLVPVLDLDLLDGPGRNGNDGIQVSDPTVDLRRDLQRTEDIPLLYATTTDPRPSYLRIAVLTAFDDGRWRPGNREIPPDQAPQGKVPGLVGVDPDVPRREYDYAVRTTDEFRWGWLPTMAPATRVRALGAWRYDTATMDFVAAEDDLTAAGITYDMTGVDLELDSRALEESVTGAASVPAVFTELPATLPTEVRRLAASVTDDATTRFGRAVALQRWFRDTYTYDLSQAESAGESYADLLAFLDEDGERRGYCEQFAAAMAIMARTLDIPARVAVGFLHPQRLDAGAWEYSSDDLHAWPELFFPGAGWVRFEPTPGDRAAQVPGYTRIDTAEPTQPTEQPSADAGAQDRPDRIPEAPDEPATADQGGSAEGVSWGTVLVAVALIALLALVGLAPGTVRGVQRARRLDDGRVESAWQELHALASDLGLAWPVGRSPRTVGGWLGRHLGAPDTDPDRPRLGRGRAPAAAAALDRLVLAVERDRYAARRDEVTPSTLQEDVRAVEASLRYGVSSRARRRARWWPRSVLGAGSRSAYGSRVGRGTVPDGEESGSRLVDHVG